jgi:hypothetical protein
VISGSLWSDMSIALQMKSQSIDRVSVENWEADGCRLARGYQMALYSGAGNDGGRPTGDLSAMI